MWRDVDCPRSACKTVLANYCAGGMAQSFLPIRAPPWTDDYGWAAANDEVDLPFFDEDAA